MDKKRDGLELRFLELCEPVVEAQGLVLYDLEYIAASGVLRIYIMNMVSKTADLDDCVGVDRALSPYIEQESWIPDGLTLEVSSPGVYRSLKQKKHFDWAQDQKISVVLNKKIPNCSGKKITGWLRAAFEAGVNIETDNFTCDVKFEDIKKVNLELMKD